MLADLHYHIADKTNYFQYPTPRQHHHHFLSSPSIRLSRVRIDSQATFLLSCPWTKLQKSYSSICSWKGKLDFLVFCLLACLFVCLFVLSHFCCKILTIGEVKWSIMRPLTLQKRSYFLNLSTMVSWRDQGFQIEILSL